MRQHTILPEAKTRAVVFGSLMRIMTAANLCEEWTLQSSKPRLKVGATMKARKLPLALGLYSEFLA